MDTYIAELQARGEKEGLDQATIDKAIEVMREVYQREHDEPDVDEGDNPEDQLPDKPIIKGIKCILCGQEAIMKSSESHSPCLICGKVNPLRGR
jgi:hypothetical protein